MAWVNPATTAPTDYTQIQITPAGVDLAGVSIWVTLIWLVNDSSVEQFVRIVDGAGRILHPRASIPPGEPKALEMPFLPATTKITATIVTPGAPGAGPVYGWVIGYPQ